jgi:hypothetical protein
MARREDIYLTAAALLSSYGEDAETLAIERMHVRMDADDVQGASFWLTIASAIDDLQTVKRQGKLH